MNKTILRVTTPEGKAYDMPNVPENRHYYEKMNRQQKDEKKHYKIDSVEVVDPAITDRTTKIEPEEDVDDSVEVTDPAITDRPKRGRNASK